MPLELPAERAGRPAPPTLAERRRLMTTALAGRLAELDPRPQEIEIAGVRALRFDPPRPPRALIVHLHGGGFRLGAPEAVAGFAAALARRLGVAVVCPAYRLAPEAPFPAGLSDGWKVLRALRETGEPAPILSGDSAGGGLAASLTALACSHGVAPAGLVLLSAWLDLTVTSPTYETNAATDPLFSRASAEEAAALYLQGASARDPLASPLFAALEGFPATLVNVGRGEVLADDARRFHAALEVAGVAAEFSVIDGMEHVAVVRDEDLTGSRETFEAVCAFVNRLVGRA